MVEYADMKLVRVVQRLRLSLSKWLFSSLGGEDTRFLDSSSLELLPGAHSELLLYDRLLGDEHGWRVSGWTH